ncbi:MAG: phage terminase large subunit family protein [Kiritimatiellae bacterium]|nr:phage terminase large subunit family protein [Kiritimatiellia bacterium]
MPDDPIRSPLSFCAPPPRLPLAEWAERNIVFGARQPSAYKGPYRVSVAPYMRGIMDALDDPATRLVVVEAGAQTGKTTLAYAWLARAMACAPGPALFVYPSEDLARAASARRIQPLFEDSPALARLIPRDRRNGWQYLSYELANGGTVAGSGANSPAQISSRPVRYLLLDEVDKYPGETSGEADAVSLALQRTKAFWNSQTVMVSTPTTPTGAIHEAYMRGTRRAYEIPCPDCGRGFVPEWRTCVKWPKGRPAEAALFCPHCAFRFSEARRRAAVAAGRWSEPAPGAEKGVESFRIPGVLAVWADIPALAVKFDRAASSRPKLRDFVNSDLGEPFIPADARVSGTQLEARAADYPDNTLRWRDGDPGVSAFDSDYVVFGGMDVQKDYFVLVLRQFRRSDAASALVFRGIIHAWAELDALMDEYRAEAVCVDCRFRTDEVYSAALSGNGIWPVAGVGGFRVPALYAVRDAYRNARGGREPVSVISANSDALLDMLADRVAAIEGAPPWEIPRAALADKDYCAQMQAMYRHNGKWVNPSRSAEHYMDAEKLALLAAEYAGVSAPLDGGGAGDADGGGGGGHGRE